MWSDPAEPGVAAGDVHVPVRGWGLAPSSGSADAGPLDDQALGRRAELSAREARKLDRFTMLGLCAARIALAPLPPDERADCSLATGTMLAGWCFAEPQLALLHGAGLAAMSPYLATAWFPAAPQGEISIRLGLEGWAKTVATDRCAGAHAIALAAARVASGRARRALAGGTEAPLSNMVRSALAGAGWQVETLAEAAAYLLLDATAPSPIALVGCDEDQQRLDGGPFLAALRERRRRLPAATALRAVAVAADPSCRDDVPRVCDALGAPPGDVVDVVATRGDSLGASSAVAAALVCDTLARAHRPGADAAAVAVSLGYQSVAALWFRARADE